MLSVVIIAWNEEKDLPRVVSSVKNIATETIVVVDKATTDETLKIAKKLGCRTYLHPHTGYVEPIRNFAINKAKSDWILLLDADEEVSSSLAQHIKTLLKNSKVDYYRLPRKNIIFGKWIKSAHWWPDYVYRLFKKGSIVWSEKIHGIPITAGIGGDIPSQEELSLIHHHYTSISEYVEHLNRYTDFQSQQVIDSGYTFSWQDLVSKPLSEFINQYFSRGGYKEGTHGLALSGLQAFSELTLYLKIWQIQKKFISEDINIDDLTNQLKKKASEYHWWQYQIRIQNSNPLSQLILKIKRKLHI